jgi:hypothetical protein
MATLMILDSVNGKNEDFNDKAPIIPNTKNASIKTLTATWYLIKYSIIFLITQQNL